MKKAVFIPCDDLILDLFKGYIINGVYRSDLNESDIYNTYSHSGIANHNKSSIALTVLILILTIPVVFVVYLILALFKKQQNVLGYYYEKIENFVGFLFGKRTSFKTRKSIYSGAVEEDVRRFLDHCKMHGYTIYVYASKDDYQHAKDRLNHLVNEKLVDIVLVLNELSEINTVIKSDNVSVDNSFFVVTNEEEYESLNSVGINNNDHYLNKLLIKIWTRGKENHNIKYSDTLLSMKRHIKHYIYAANNLFFQNELIIYIEQDENHHINDYISKNYDELSKKMSDKGFVFLYIPQLARFYIDDNSASVKIAIPEAHNFESKQLRFFIKSLEENISPLRYYQHLLSSMGLPDFPKPSLLRRLWGGLEETKNRYTYSHIKVSTPKELDSYFEWYINQLRLPNDHEGVMYSAIDPNALSPDEINRILERDSIDSRIDMISRSHGVDKQYVYAEILSDLLAELKNYNSVVYSEVIRSLDAKLADSYTNNPSALTITTSGSILLNSYSLEVKMGPLPKALYILFLNHPEGIRLKELGNYRDELYECYAKLTNRIDEAEILDRINSLVNPLDHSINIQCSRIRDSFRSVVHDSIARNYYITGERGEPMKIQLDRNLVTMQLI